MEVYTNIRYTDVNTDLDYFREIKTRATPEYIAHPHAGKVKSVYFIRFRYANIIWNEMQLC